MVKVSGAGLPLMPGKTQRPACTRAPGSRDAELEMLMVRSAVSVSARNGAPSERRSDVLELRLSVLRAALEQQRDFRREQLAHADVRQPTHGSPVTDDSTDRGAGRAVREVEALVAAGARRALADIEVALAQMRIGRYGYCRMCGTDIPVVVLDAIPSTTVCLACQQSTDRSTVEGGRGAHGRVSARGRHA
jgi:RNA polymerase-binding transcription factor DksA